MSRITLRVQSSWRPPSVTLVLALVPLQRFPIDLKISKRSALCKMKFPGMLFIKLILPQCTAVSWWFRHHKTAVSCMIWPWYYLSLLLFHDGLDIPQLLFHVRIVCVTSLCRIWLRILRVSWRVNLKTLSWIWWQHSHSLTQDNCGKQWRYG